MMRWTHIDFLASVDEAAQAGADVSEGRADAGERVLLRRLQTNKVGGSELLLGRENH